MDYLISFPSWHPVASSLALVLSRKTFLLHFLFVVTLLFSITLLTSKDTKGDNSHQEPSSSNESYLVVALSVIRKKFYCHRLVHFSGQMSNKGDRIRLLHHLSSEGPLLLKLKIDGSWITNCSISISILSYLIQP